MSYLEFPVRVSDSGKTFIFDVVHNILGDKLGEIRWYGPWRKYCFFPFVGIIFDSGCLKDIQTKIDNETKAHKESKLNA
jgi:hypothetical protein